MLRLNVLVVDDEPGINKSLTYCLENSGHTVHSVRNSKEALDRCSKNSFQLAFVDLRLGTESGLDLIQILIQSNPEMKIVIITAFATIESAVDAMKRGAFDYLPKPFTPKQVEIVTEKVAERYLLEEKVESLKKDLQKSDPILEFTSQNSAMQSILEIAKKTASTDATLLLLGENGTGKNLLAKIVHRWSPRLKKPFSTISCPSLSMELLESELFGHVKGAFTGAIRDYPGKIALSEGGTLFLDEIGDLPWAIQPKLLRFIQDREYERVGDAVVQKADVRIITATNRNLESLVQEGKFREDLYYRLNVISLKMPALRERKEDIPTITKNLIHFFNLQYGKNVSGFTAEASQALLHYPWPGNIRELRNVLERAIILSQTNELKLEDLNLGTLQPSSAVRIGDSISLQKIEEEHIRKVISSSLSLDEAAKILGIDPATLWRKRKEYRL